MKVLLDTHVLLWSLSTPERIASEAADAFRQQVTGVVVSVVSLWEIAIKRAAGRLEAPDDLPEIVRSLGHEVLPVRAAHAWSVGSLPLHHRDPFDRLLVAQAMAEGLTFVTADREIMVYDVKILRA
jgi:PIN domain nuclease of toxin-antitoxin system